MLPSVTILNPFAQNTPVCNLEHGGKMWHEVLVVSPNMRRTLEILRHTQSPRKEVTCNLNVLKEANTHSSSKKVEFHKSVYYFFLQKKVFVVVILSLATRRRRRTSVLRDHTATSAGLSSPLLSSDWLPFPHLAGWIGIQKFGTA